MTSKSKTVGREVRRETAEKRNAAWAEKSPKDQLASLDARLGKGQGAKKQRAKILKKMEAEKSKN